MNTDTSTSTWHPASHATWLRKFAYGAIAAVLASTVVAALILYGAERRASADAEMARDIEQENQTSCRALGLGPETQRFADCVAEVSAIRSRHEARLARHAPSLP